MARSPNVPTESVQANNEVTWRTYPNDAAEILPDGHRSRTLHCKQPGCGAPMWWGRTRAGDSPCPFDVRPDGTRTGTSHWRTCTDRPPRKG